MGQPITQERVCFLETAGEDLILEMVAEGNYLSDIAEKLDPGNTVGIEKTIISKWLSGKLKRNVPLKLADGTVLPPETEEQAKARAHRHKEARELWAESVVEGASKKLMDENDGRLAILRKSQAEFALRIAAIFDKRFAEQKNQTNVAVQVNVESGEYHLDALRRRKMTATLAHPTPATPSLPCDTPLLLAAG